MFKKQRHYTYSDQKQKRILVFSLRTKSIYPSLKTDTYSAPCEHYFRKAGVGGLGETSVR